MKDALRAGVQFAAVVCLCAGAAALPADKPGLMCSVRPISIQTPAYMVVDAVVRGERLFLPDYTAGLREIDLTSGRDLRSLLPMGTGRGQVTGPQHLACNPERCAVWGDRYRWLYYDADWRFVSEIPALDAGAAGQPLMFADRMVVFGVARADKTGGGTAFLFVLYDDGSILPLQEFQQGMPIPEVVKRIQFNGPTVGGLGALADGGWVFVDPHSYSVFVFDDRDRLKGAWRGANKNFRAPNWSAYEPVHDSSARERYYRWCLAQPQVKRPVILGDDLLGIVVGLPDGTLQQRHVLDLYKLDGKPVALGIPIPGVEAARLVVADAGPGRLVLIGQESWEPSSPTLVWEVEAPQIGNP